MNTRTRPERNLEKLEHEPEKCDWKTTDTQKMRSRKCRTGPSVCGKRPPNSSIYVSTSEVKTTTEGITISAPNENSQKASKSVNVLAAGSQDEICVNEHQN